MDIINKIEDKTNTIIYKMWFSLVWLINKLTPQRLKDFINRTHLKMRKIKIKIKNKIKLVLLYLFKKLKFYNKIFFEKAESLKDYPFKEKIQERRNQVFIFYKSKSPKEHVLYFMKSSFELMTKSKNKKASDLKKPSYVLGLILLFAALGSLTVVTKVYRAENPSRSPANAVQKIHRPDYEKFSRRTLKVHNVSIPLIVKNKKEVHSVVVDFTVRTDTVFAKLFLDNKQHMIKDRFYTSTYRVPASFPLEREGKTVIKEKVMRELNSLLHEQRVEGRVLDINFVYHIAN